MKKLLIAASLLLAVGCQSTGNQSEAEALPPTLQLSGSQYKFVGKEAKTIGVGSKSAKSFEAIQKAVAALQWDTVKTLATQHLTQYPGNSDAFLFLSIAHAGAGNPARARFYAELVLKSEPSNAVALNIMGVLKRNEAVLPEDYRRALVYFQLARQAVAQSATPVLNAASLNLEIGNFQEARSDFRQAQEKCGGCIASLVGSALAAQSLGLYDESKVAINATLEKDPKNETARLLLASQYYYVDKEQEKGQAMLADLLNGGKAESEVQKEARSMMNRIEAVAH